MSLEAIGSQALTPEFILRKAIERSPQYAIAITMHEDGTYNIDMSHISPMVLAFLKTIFEIHGNDYIIRTTLMEHNYDPAKKN